MLKKLGLAFVGICAVSSIALQGWTFLDRAPTFSYADAVEEVVYIQVEKIMDNNNSGGYGVGTGFFISNEGYVVTNYHVIDDADTIWVITSNKIGYLAEVVGSDRFADISVLKIVPYEKINVAKWGDSSKVQYGDTVIGLGNPNGLAWSFTKGVVSEPKRDGANLLFPVIQSDASINHGNSGGPLYNEAGEVIGVNEAIISGGESSGSVGISFSLPSNEIKHIVNKILKGEEVKHGRVGISIDTYTEETPTMEKPAGVSITAIDKEGPAAKAGLEKGDIVTAIDGKPVIEHHAFQQTVMSKEPGTAVKLTVKRNDKVLDFTVTLMEATHPTERMEKEKKEKE